MSGRPKTDIAPAAARIVRAFIACGELNVRGVMEKADVGHSAAADVIAALYDEGLISKSVQRHNAHIYTWTGGEA